MRNLKWVSIYAIIFIAVIQLISSGISYFYDFTFIDTLFVVGLIVLMAGILFSMQGRSNFANRFTHEDSDLGTHTSSVVEAEREAQEIRNQGTIKYMTENRMLRFRNKPASMIISGIITLIITYLLL